VYIKVPRPGFEPRTKRLEGQFLNTYIINRHFITNGLC